MFVATAEGEFINLDHVTKIYRRDEATFALLNGAETGVELLNDEIDPERTTAPVIKAEPGFTLLYAMDLDPDGKIDVCRHPIVGWRVRPNSIEPIAAGLQADDLDGYPDRIAIRYPDGQIEVRDNATFENEAGWLQDWQERTAKWARWKLERAAAEKKKAAP
jgi:hypothetical protein